MKSTDTAAGPELPPRGDRVTPNIYRCPDGVYRWVYAFDLLRSPSVFFTVCKVMCLSFGAVYLFVLLLSLGGLDGWAGLWDLTWPFLILLAVFLLISAVAYLIVAAGYGWSYVVLFEMSDTEVRHITVPKQLHRAQALGWLSAMAGLAAGRPAQVGLGLSVMARNSSTSAFAEVKTIKPRRSRHTIYVNQRLNRNQVYAEDADFDFVQNYILAHCVNANLK